MRCTDPMNAPRPPPTIPARRRRRGGGVATLLISDASQGMKVDCLGAADGSRKSKRETGGELKPPEKKASAALFFVLKDLRKRSLLPARAPQENTPHPSVPAPASDA